MGLHCCTTSLMVAKPFASVNDTYFSFKERLSELRNA